MTKVETDYFNVHAHSLLFGENGSSLALAVIIEECEGAYV